jgi:tRNA dimethylallyltransferase
MPASPIIFIVGPTASGKTEVAAALAEKIPLEIVSCDSMQVYREMNIISCKPSARLRKNIPHHLLDVVSAQEDYSVADYGKRARLVIKKILDDGQHHACVVGGSGLYMSVLLDGLFAGGKTDIKLREALKNEAQIRGKEYLYKRLQEVDEAAAAKIHPHDLRRIIRALEVFELTSQPISQLQKQRQGLWGNFEIKIFCLDRPREELYARINSRVAGMFKQGAVEEVKTLLKLNLSQTAKAVIGIGEIKGYLDGYYDLAEAEQRIAQNSRHYAKRQLTWFRKDKRLQWIEIEAGETAKRTATRIIQAFSAEAGNHFKKERKAEQ